MPTILEVTGIPAPEMVDGIAQKPIEGVSMAYTFDKANANAPSRHKTQYFEMFGNRAHLSRRLDRQHARPIRAALGRRGHDQPDDPAQRLQVGAVRPDQGLDADNDLAASNPDKLKEMQDLFMGKPAKYQVLPLDTSVATRLVAPRPSITAGRTEFTYSGEP